MGCSYLAMKPTAPLLALPCSGMKLPSPLRAMKGHFWAISTLQRCCRFQWGVQRGLQRCCRFQWGVQRGLQRCWWFQSCPVIACYARKSSPCATCNGCEREKVRPASPNGRKMLFSSVLGEVFRGAVAERAVLGEFFRGSAAGESPNAFTANVWMCVRSPCGLLSSAGEKFRMQFPSRHFKLSQQIVEILLFCLRSWSGLVLWTGCFEGCWLLLVVLTHAAACGGMR